MEGLFISSGNQQQEKTDPAWWFIFRDRKMLVTIDGDKATVPLLHGEWNHDLPLVRKHYIGTLDGTDCYAAEVTKETPPPEGMVFHGLWGLFGCMADEFHRTALRAMHIIDWDRTDQYCSRCGTKNELKIGERAKICPACNALSFPRISPAVIVLVERGRRVLLARASRFMRNWYSVLAGFVEPGETLEDVVRREVKEETGIDVKDIRYFGSQPWPFPDSLMVAFTAKHAGGEIQVDGTEIVEAQWFEYDRLPDIPGKISIARALIDWFVEKHTKRRS
ncbi:MAG: NADH pyrophosphatase [Syntrophorhabdus sp. PtaU1.Bin002]|nr:MAG: NADH pyrophosphatase [Syntrophorhabdus sp. PtaB.Bin006]OPY71948.1 MAG: NADH pyrophosphatase [Syntrophorhabdus sp. PtaU1.Bin002]